MNQRNGTHMAIPRFCANVLYHDALSTTEEALCIDPRRSAFACDAPLRSRNAASLGALVLVRVATQTSKTLCGK